MSDIIRAPTGKQTRRMVLNINKDIGIKNKVV